MEQQKPPAVPVVTQSEWVERLLQITRPNEHTLLAYYEHRLGVICCAPRCFVMPVDDHLAHRGDGVFESLKFEAGRVQLLQEHMERLTHSAQSLDIVIPMSLEQLYSIIIAVAQASGQDTGMVRVLVGRGAGGFGIDPAECPESSVYVVAYQWEPKPEKWFSKGVTAFRSAIPAKQGYLATIKSANYVPNMLMVQEAKAKGQDIAVAFDSNNNLTEAAVANIAMVDASGTLVIPVFSNALAGTTILRVAHLLKDLRSVVFRAISYTELSTATEILLFGTGVDCVGVSHWEGQPVGNGVPGPVAHQIRELLQADLLAYGIAL